MTTCIVCGKEFELTRDQKQKAKYLVGYRPNCGSEVCLRVRRRAFNNGTYM